MKVGDFTQNLQVRQNAGQARIYNSRIGKFTQPDTIIPGAGNPQAFNRYAYVLNNPVNFVDPSGHDPWWCGDSTCTLNYLDSMSNASARSNPLAVDKSPLLILVCGFDTGDDCTTTYPTSGGAERPLYLLAQEWERQYGSDSVIYLGFGEPRPTKRDVADKILELINNTPDSTVYLAGHSAGADAIAIAIHEYLLNGGDDQRIGGVALLDPYLSAQLDGAAEDLRANSDNIREILGERYNVYIANLANGIQSGTIVTPIPFAGQHIELAVDNDILKEIFNGFQEHQMK